VTLRLQLGREAAIQHHWTDGQCIGECGDH
jgi:hypothetical protein